MALETQGVILKRGDGGSPEGFTAVGEIISFDGPDGTASEIDVTNLSSTAKEYLVGLKDEGSFSFEAFLAPDDTAQIGLRSDRDNRSLRNFQLLLTDVGPTELDFAAYVMRFAISGGVDNAIRASISLRISGPVTWT